MAATTQLLTDSAQDALDDLLYRICEKLQLSRANYQLAEQRYEAIGRVLEAVGSRVARYRPQVYPQGSMRIGTTVKPVANQEFDLDIVCEFAVDPRLIANPTALLDAVEAVLSASAAHKGRLERKKRCIRVVYANEFHLDILPACPDGSGRPNCLVVPDRDAREWKASNPKGFAQWFLETAELITLRVAAAEDLPPQEAAAEKSVLKLVVQLLKRGRDVCFSKMGAAATPSVVITTLAALHFAGEVRVSLALENILERVLSAVPPSGRLKVPNPTNPLEDFSERWSDPAAYHAFVADLRAFRRAYSEMQAKRGPAQKKALGELFGEEVAHLAFEAQAQEIYDRKEQGALGVLRGQGTLVTNITANAMPVSRNVFYGEESK